MKTAVAFRHIAIEDLGILADVLAKRGFQIRYADAWQDDLAALLNPDPDLLIVLGGPMGVYEAATYPFITQELQLIRDRLASGKPMLGICLGAQFIAHAAGSAVYPGPAKEIGYSPLTLTREGEASCLSHLAAANFNVLHWHGDTFDLPAGAVRLCETDITRNQGFTLGHNVLALQFHVEAAPEHMDRWIAEWTRDLAAIGIDTNQFRATAATIGAGVATAGRRVFESWLDQLQWITSAPALAAGSP
jgi:GMP synthase (glutamine-hydrolysing)